MRAQYISIDFKMKPFSVVFAPSFSLYPFTASLYITAHAELVCYFNKIPYTNTQFGPKELAYEKYYP